MTTVTIMRPRHPLQGQSLRVLGQLRRHGRLELLAVLPDGSKTLIPAAWTDLHDADAEDPTSCDQAGQATTATLGTLTDLGQTVGLVRALSTRMGEIQEQAARPSPIKEDNRAACTAESATRPDTDATPARPASRPTAHHSDRPAGRPDHQGHRISGKAGGQ